MPISGWIFGSGRTSRHWRAWIGESNSQGHIMFGIRRRKPVDLLSREVMRFSDRDRLSVRDLLNGGVCVLGRTGSGKSSGSARALAAGLVNLPQAGLLILSAKPEDKEFWSHLFAIAGRSDDLIVFAPG